MSTNPWIQSQHGPLLAKMVDKHGDSLKERYGTDDVYFALWLHALNRAVQRRVLVSFDDLEDWDYWSNYDAGLSPTEAALHMLEDNGWDKAYDVGVIR